MLGGLSPRIAFLLLIVVVTAAACLFLTLAPADVIKPRKEATNLTQAKSQSSVPRSAGSAPRLEISPCMDHHLGKGKVGESLPGKLAFGNSGTADLNFVIEAGCGCASIEPRAGRLAPGEKIAVRFEVRLREEGKDERFFLRLLTNDPVQPIVEHRVAAFCPTWLNVDPPHLDLGRVKPGSKQVARLNLRDPHGQPWRPQELEWECSSDLLALAWASAADSETQLNLEVGPLPKGEFNGYLLLKGLDGDGERKEYRFSITGRALGPITVAPATLAVRSSVAAGEVVGTVVVRLSDSVQAERLHVECPPGLEARLAPPRAATELRAYRIHRTATLPEKAEQAELLIWLHGDEASRESVAIRWRD